MSVGHNATLRRFLDLCERGEAQRLAEKARTRTEWARLMGISESSLRGVLARCKAMGLTPPDVSGQICDSAGSSGQISVDEFEDEAPTVRVQQPIVEAQQQLIAGERDPNVATSTLYDQSGNVLLEWVKRPANANRVDPAEILRRAFGDEMPKADPVESPRHADDDLLCVYPLGDPHIGLLAWEQETGANFDLAIAERNLVGAVDRLVALASPAKQALILSVGDYFHSDGIKNATTKGTPVDVDGRTPKMIATGIRTMRRMIDRALTKHEHVTVICSRGNHDELLSLVLAIALAQFYEREPRVTVDQSPQMFHWFRFGANLIGATHGNRQKPMDMLGVMAVDRAKDWGETKHRRFYCGHYHHRMTKEVPGVTVEYLPTLAASDAWHSGQGYRSAREMQLDEFHIEDGHVNRHIVGIERVTKHAG